MDRIFQLFFWGFLCVSSTVANARPFNTLFYRANFANAVQVIPSLLTEDQHRRMEQITSYFENSTIVFQYDYIENLGDGRGYTAGRIGFTTGTGDLFFLVQSYCSTDKSPAICGYLPLLELLAAQESGDVSGLGGNFVSAWKLAAQDARFQRQQDQVTEDMYFTPAMKHAVELGIQTALGKAILYDSIIQHGNGGDADGLPAMIDRASDKAGGTPLSGKPSEVDWLASFLAVRRETLLHPADTASQSVWADSVDRVDFLVELLQKKNFNLDPPINMDPGSNSVDTVIP